METTGINYLLPQAKYNCHWVNFHKNYAYSTTFVMWLYTEFHENLLNSLVVDTRSQKDKWTYLFSKERLKTNCSLSREHCAILLTLKVLILWLDFMISVHSCWSDRHIHSNIYMNLIQFLWVKIEDFQINIVQWACLHSSLQILHRPHVLTEPQRCGYEVTGSVEGVDETAEIQLYCILWWLVHPASF